jgi:hypothetical protein
LLLFPHHQIQRRERAFGVETLQHQRWSGAELLDLELLTVTGGLASTAAMADGNTEMQFKQKRMQLQLSEQGQEAEQSIPFSKDAVDSNLKVDDETVGLVLSPDSSAEDQ